MSDGLVGPVIRKVTIDASDNVWVATSTGVSRISFITGLDNGLVASDKNFSVYPNPTSNNVTIDFGLENNQIENVSFYNAMMQLVKEVNIDSYDQSISVSLKDLDKGIYFVKHGDELEKLIVH